MHIRPDRISPYTIAVLAGILAVYIITALALYPDLPITTRMAENSPGFADSYPPFRTDEYNYYQISRDLLDGRLYSPGSFEYGYPLGFSVVAAPFVAVMGPAGGYAANVLVTWLCAIMFYLAARRYAARWKALVMTAVLAFAGLNWFYAVSWYSEPLAQLLVLASFFLLTTPRDCRWYRASLVASGIAAALVLFVRPHYILITMPFFAYLAWAGGIRRFDRKALIFAGGAAGIVALWIIRNAVVFGGPFTFEYTRHLADYIPGAESRYMGGNIFLGAHQLLFDQYHGLFTITPVFLLFPVGLRKMWLADYRRESVMLAAAVIIMALFAASSTYPFTEFGLGSRHMVPAIPLMLLPAVFFLDRALFPASMVALLAAYSFYQAGIGWFTGGEPGRGFFLGILNEAQSRAVILARKGLLPALEYDSQQELVAAYLDALEDANLYRFLQTLEPEFLTTIVGHERELMIFLRNQPDPTGYIASADPARGISIHMTPAGEAAE